MAANALCIVLLQAIFVSFCFANGFDPKFACDFSQDLCNWENTNTSVQFKRKVEGTGVDGTGPSAGHTDGSITDYYIYIDTFSLPKYAELVSPRLGSDCVVACFRFWYHMYGRFINRIEVGLNPDNTVLYNRSGDNGNFWRCATVPITSCYDKQIYIRAYESVEGVQSQIAFDDLGLAYVDNKLQCSEKVCEVNSSDHTPSTIIVTSTTSTVSTSPVFSSTTLDSVLSSSGPPTTTTPTSLYLLSLLAVPFVVLAIGIVYIMKRKRNDKRGSGVNNIGLNNSRHEHDGYSRDPTGDGPRRLPDVPDDNVYVEITDDLKRPDDDGGYINPVERPVNGNDYTDLSDQATESSMDKTHDQGYISVVDMSDVKQSRDHGPDLTRALPTLPDMNSKAEKTPSSFPEIDYPDDKEDYLHPVGKAHNVDHSERSNMAENLPSGFDDDYLKPTRSIAIPSRFNLTKELSTTQPNYANQNTDDNMNRKSSTTI